MDIEHRIKERRLSERRGIKGVFDDVLSLAANSAAIMDDATVYTELLFDTGGYYDTRYTGKNRDMVEKYAKKQYEAIDPVRSPSLSNIFIYHSEFAIVLKYYWLD